MAALNSTSLNSTHPRSHESIALSYSQNLAIEITERIGSCISIPCVLFLMSTFLIYYRLRTPSNTLLFSASPANLFAGIASLIGRAGLSRPNAATCQVQGFFLEWFMQADAYWACAGAINVMLVFFLRFNAEQLRRLNPIYWATCYGIPGIPAIFGLIYRKNGKHMYGDATLWCWYSNNYMLSRLYAYYIPIWIVVGFSGLLYTTIGIKIHRHKALLRSLQSQSHLLSSTNPSSLCSRTVEVEHEVTYETRTLPYRPNTAASTAVITAPPNPGRFEVFKSIFSSVKNIFTDDSNLSPSDRTTLAYSRVAFLFFASNLITWVPASINRVYAIYHPDHPSFVLNIAAAIVLPLQGLWNCVVFMTVNRVVLGEVFGVWKGKVLWLKDRCFGSGAVADTTGEDGNLDSFELASSSRNISIESDDDVKLDLRDALAYIR